jgi:hypothetical protein
MNPQSLTFRPSAAVMDANVRIGQRHDEWAPLTRQTLLREMDERGVGHAVVHHVHGLTHSGQVAWRMLREFIGEEPRLLPQVCVHPIDEDLALVQRLASERVLSSARLACEPGETIVFIPEFYGAILEFLQDRNVPLWVDIWSVDPRDLIASARAFPKLPIVLLESHYVQHILIKPLMRCIPQLHLELSRYESFGQVEELTSEFGAERLIYGSGYPRYAMGTMLYYLHHCDLKDQELAAICSGNLRRLLRLEVTP